VSLGLLDTSVVIDLHRYIGREELLPEEAFVSALTMAEIVQGPLFARSETDRRARSRIVLDAHRAFPEPLPFDSLCVPAYLSVVNATVDVGRHPRRRTIDLLIAATAQAHGLPLYTQNPADVDHLADLVPIVAI
jgi:predicted nucleic acid-binding protein